MPLEQKFIATLRDYGCSADNQRLQETLGRPCEVDAAFHRYLLNAGHVNDLAGRIRLPLDEAA